MARREKSQEKDSKATTSMSPSVDIKSIAYILFKQNQRMLSFPIKLLNLYYTTEDARPLLS